MDLKEAGRDALALAGVACIIAAAALWHPLAGLFVTGVALVGGSFLSALLGGRS